MMDLSLAADIAAVAFPTAGAVVAIYKIRRGDLPGGAPMDDDVKGKCPVHPMMIDRLNRGDKQFEQICVGLTVIRRIVLDLAVKAGIPADQYKGLVD